MSKRQHLVQHLREAPLRQKLELHVFLMLVKDPFCFISRDIQRLIVGALFLPTLALATSPANGNESNFRISEATLVLISDSSRLTSSAASDRILWFSTQEGISRYDGDTVSSYVKTRTGRVNPKHRRYTILRIAADAYFLLPKIMAYWCSTR